MDGQLKKWQVQVKKLMEEVGGVRAGHTRDNPSIYIDEYPHYDEAINSSKYDKEKPRKYSDMYNDIKNDSHTKGDKCNHEWYTTGRSPITNDEWENCKHCDIAREDVK